MTPNLHPTIPYGLCQCGCGAPTKIANGVLHLYLRHHHLRRNSNKTRRGLPPERRPIKSQWEGIPCFLIPLTKLREAIIDPESLPLVEGKWWFYDGSYARRNIMVDGKHATIAMHRVILPPSDGMIVDHINGNKLDNRRRNLRLITPSGNNINRVLQSNSHALYPGITWHKKTQKWTVRINIEKKGRYLGVFSDFNEAFRVRKEAEAKYYSGITPRVILRTPEE